MVQVREYGGWVRQAGVNRHKREPPPVAHGSPIPNTTGQAEKLAFPVSVLLHQWRVYGLMSPDSANAGVRSVWETDDE